MGWVTGVFLMTGQDFIQVLPGGWGYFSFKVTLKTSLLISPRFFQLLLLTRFNQLLRGTNGRLILLKGYLSGILKGLMLFLPRRIPG